MGFIERIFVFLIALGLGLAVVLRTKFFVDITILGFLFLLGEFTFGPTIP